MRGHDEGRKLNLHEVGIQLPQRDGLPAGSSGSSAQSDNLISPALTVSGAPPQNLHAPKR